MYGVLICEVILFFLVSFGCFFRGLVGRILDLVKVGVLLGGLD